MNEKFEQEMQSRGWRRQTGLHRGEIWFIDSGHDYCVQIHDGEFSLCRFDDSDNSDGVAEARWLTITQGDDIVDLREDLERLTFARKKEVA